MTSKNNGQPEHQDDPQHVAAVQALFVEHQPAVRALVLALWPDFNTANDIVQETFLTVTRKAANFQIGTDFAAWVATIARFKIKEARQRVKRNYEVLSPEIIDALCACQPPEDGREPELAALGECMGRLAPKAREIVVMRYDHAHSLAEIGTRIGWTAGAVHVALSRARALLKNCINHKLASAR